jgi:hypothetical protein
MRQLIERLYSQLGVNSKSQMIEERIKTGEIKTIEEVDAAIEVIKNATNEFSRSITA